MPRPGPDRVGASKAAAIRDRLVGLLGTTNARSLRRSLEREVAEGSVEATVMLGMLFLSGLPSNRHRARLLFANAAERGDAGAAWIRAASFGKNGALRPEARRAFEWATAAAEHGELAAISSAERLAERHGYELAPRRVTAWYRKAAARGDREALYRLAHRLHEGEGVRRDRRAAVSAWRRAARLGDASSRYCLGLSYELGEGVRQSWPRALACYRAAARSGDDDACHAIADYHARIEKNPRKCVQWLGRAARLGHAESQCELGIHYIHGDGVRQDMARAARLYRQSAEQGYGWAMQLLGRCHLEGDGVRRDRRAARRWFERAVEAGQQTEDRETVRVARSLLEEMNSERRKA